MQRGQELRGVEYWRILRTYAGESTESDRATDCPIPINAASRLTLRKLEHLVLLQQGIHGFPKQILLGPTMFFRKLVQQLNLHVIQVQSNLRS
jgi:hypothetical protein